MSIEISFEGLMTLEPPENRALALLKVHYNDTVYDWSIYVPQNNLGDIGGFLNSSKERIKSQIDEKELEWEMLEPKTRTLGLPSLPGMEPMTVPIEKSEIVKPDYPDYYAKRRNEYPPIGDQLDAFWKGQDSPEYSIIMAKIAEVKEKYPKK